MFPKIGNYLEQQCDVFSYRIREWVLNFKRSHLTNTSGGIIAENYMTK
jgi:hypothetical protein